MNQEIAIDYKSNHNFSGAITGVCKEWIDEIAECSKGNEAEACCRELGIPDLCFGYCKTE